MFCTSCLACLAVLHSLIPIYSLRNLCLFPVYLQYATYVHCLGSHSSCCTSPNKITPLCTFFSQCFRFTVSTNGNQLHFTHPKKRAPMFSSMKGAITYGVRWVKTGKLHAIEHYLSKLIIAVMAHGFLSGSPKTTPSWRRVTHSHCKCSNTPQIRGTESIMDTWALQHLCVFYGLKNSSGTTMIDYRGLFFASWSIR